MLAYSRQSISEEDIAAAAEAMRSNHLTQGKRCEAFESDLADYCGAKYAAVVNSATSALFALYRCLGLCEGDEVLTTPISFAATSNMLLECGARPVFCDIKYNGNIDENGLEEKITKKTKALVSVDFGGNPAEADRLRALCKKHGLFFISDSSHALGSSYNGKKVGSLADATVFSFHAIKPITTFEGGAVVTEDRKLYEKIKRFASHGIVKKKLYNSDMSGPGFNFRLSDVACAVGQSQLSRLDDFIQKREQVAAYYDKAFAGNPYFSPVPISGGCTSSRHLYPILLHPGMQCGKEELFADLLAAGIGVQVHYKPIYQFSYYKKRLGQMRLQRAEEFYKSELSIPCHQLMNKDDAAFVADSVLALAEKHGAGCDR
ncbi:MAG: UDP-4-amino-4,6-dideoxy-N-acetyl-beta-L-altrosamine transaminase [Campylobacterota bacterium]